MLEFGRNATQQQYANSSHQQKANHLTANRKEPQHITGQQLMSKAPDATPTSTTGNTAALIPANHALQHAIIHAKELVATEQDLTLTAHQQEQQVQHAAETINATALRRAALAGKARARTTAYAQQANYAARRQARARVATPLATTSAQPQHSTFQTSAQEQDSTLTATAKASPASPATTSNNNAQPMQSAQQATALSSQLESRKDWQKLAATPTNAGMDYPA